MEHSWILLIAMIGLILCVYADRLLLCTPGGQFTFSDMKDNARMAKLFEAKQNFIDACKKYGVKYSVRERPRHDPLLSHAAVFQGIERGL